MGEGGGFGWVCVEGWGEKAGNYNWITIKFFLKSEWTNQRMGDNSKYIYLTKNLWQEYILENKQTWKPIRKRQNKFYKRANNLNGPFT